MLKDRTIVISKFSSFSVLIDKVQIDLEASCLIVTTKMLKSLLCHGANVL